MATSEPPSKRKEYPPELKRRLVSLVENSSNIVDAARDGNVTPLLLRKWIKLAETRPDLEPVRRGAKPLLPPEAEKDSRDYVIARQRGCRPVYRSDIIHKARTITELVCDVSVGKSWYKRFIDSHAELTNRTAQFLTKSRGNVIDIDVTTLFNDILKAPIDNKLDATRIFDMDETAFQSKKSSKQVIALHGSKNVWNLDPATNLHLSIVACGSASGDFIPPTFILPGKTVKVDVLSGCDVDVATVTTTPSSFMDMGLFSTWLRFFSDLIPAQTKRPVLLVMDGCTSYNSLESLEHATALGILIALPPSNATHLLQPLDVAVFATRKRTIKAPQRELMEDHDDGVYSIDRKAAIKVVCMAWMRSRITQNIFTGFKACGILPLSLVEMDNRLSRFETNGTEDQLMEATWLQVKPIVRTEVLTLPTAMPASKQRKQSKVGVGNWLPIVNAS